MSEHDADSEPRISISKGSTLILDGDALTSDLRMLEFPNICLLIWSLKEDINNYMSMLFVRKHIKMMFSMWVRYL